MTAIFCGLNNRRREEMKDGNEFKLVMRQLSGNDPKTERVKEIIVSMLETIEVSKATPDEALSAVTTCLSWLMATTTFTIEQLKEELEKQFVGVLLSSVEDLRKSIPNINKPK
jgi:hypothetical protein